MVDLTPLSWAIEFAPVSSRGRERGPSSGNTKCTAQEFGCKVCAIRPYEGLQLGMDGELLEHLHVLKWFENEPMHLVRQVDFAFSSVAEAEPDRIPSDVAGVDDAATYELLSGSIWTMAEKDRRKRSGSSESECTPRRCRRRRTASRRMRRSAPSRRCAFPRTAPSIAKD